MPDEHTLRGNRQLWVYICLKTSMAPTQRHAHKILQKMGKREEKR